MEKILLNSKKSKVGVNGNSFLNVSFETNKMLLPSTSIDYVVNPREEYEKERMECDNVRLVCTINPLCSNVLFNNKTEVVYNEGSDNPIVSVYHPFKIKKEYLAEYLTLGKESAEKVFTPYKLIQDTQISRYDNFSYHCGLDIFNNHILRSNTFKTVMLPKDKNQVKINDFNTISDLLRTYGGIASSGYSDVLTSSRLTQDLTLTTQLHLYTVDEIDTFKESVTNKVVEKNGWIGFINSPNITPYDTNNKAVKINHIINNKNSCEFIDLYPNRELFFFTPLYNNFRHRDEKNWNYCLTYPSSSTTEVDFINSELKSLKIAVFDDDTRNSKGVESILIISTCRHGLTKDDIINIYLNDESTPIIKGTFVNEIIDDFSFYVNKNGNTLSNEWVSLDSDKLKEKEEGMVKYYQQCKYVYKNLRNEEYYPIINDKVNLSSNNQNYSFKKVVGDVECEYYVRIFSRIPNWKFADKKITEANIYENNGEMIKKFQQIGNDFESHIGKLGYANNVYGDDISEIVFTDDINLKGLKDNLGRPISTIYLTILKNNRGYKDWYNARNANDTNIEISGKTELSDSDLLKNNDTLEYSHCFGKLTQGFNLSYRTLINKNISHLKRISNVTDEDKLKCSSGLDYSRINENRSDADKDEVIYRYFDTKINNDNELGDVNFYGDVVCFSPLEYVEESLQMPDFRFNTAQRDGLYSQVYEDGFKNRVENARSGNAIYHDEIFYDDFDKNPNRDRESFEIITHCDDITNVMKRNEGYYYQSHYEIPIHTFSNDVITQYPKFYTPMSILLNNDGTYSVKTMEKTYLELHDKIYLYNLSEAENDNIEEDKKYYEFTVEKVRDRRNFIIKLEKGDEFDERCRYKIFKPDETIPNYALLLKNKSFGYIWRNLIKNGFDNESIIEEYPFTNGALYANKFINFYLKRQDPNNYVKDYAWDGYSLHSDDYPYDMNIKELDVDNENNFFEENAIEC